MNKYPIRVLRRKIKSASNTPLVIDNTTGSLKLPKALKSSEKFWKPIAIVAVLGAMAILGTQVIKPVVETTINNKQYSKLASGSAEDSKLTELKLIKVQYGRDARGRRTAIAPTADNNLDSALEYLATLPDIEEVEANKKAIKVTFFAAELGD